MQAEEFKNALVLIAYLELHLPKSRNAEEKRKRRELFNSKKCAEIFQRSSSCVEGRNGQLALMQHFNRSIKPRKLSSLRVVHNYFLVRDDGATAAERFFEQKHKNLFEWLLKKIDCPPLPTKKRVAAQKFEMAA